MTLWLASRVLALGHRRVERGDLDGARRCVRLLELLRNTGRFELRAAIAFAENDPARAVEILRDAADRYPQVWILDSMLGQGFSDQGAYDQARERFERVYRTAGPAGLALSNLALVAGREGDHEGALALLDRSVAEGERVPPDRIAASRAWSLSVLGRLEEAEATLRPEPRTPYGEALLALVLARLGRETEAWDQVRESFRSGSGHGPACEATRVLLGGTAAREYRAVLSGPVDPARHPLGKPWFLMATVWINADDEADALELARRIEPDLLDLRIVKSTWSPVGPDARRGYVARAEGLTLARRDSKWESRGS